MHCKSMETSVCQDFSSRCNYLPLFQYDISYSHVWRRDEISRQDHIKTVISSSQHHFRRTPHAEKGVTSDNWARFLMLSKKALIMLIFTCFFCRLRHQEAKMDAEWRLQYKLSAQSCYGHIRFWAADPKGTMSYRTEGWIFRPSKRTSVRTSPEGPAPPPRPQPLGPLQALSRPQPPGP